MPDKTNSLDALLSQLPDRVAARYWARGRSNGAVSRAEALDLVSKAFIRQDSDALRTATAGRDFYVGFRAFRNYFSSSTPTEEEIKATIAMAIKDYYAFHALRFLAQLVGDEYSEALKAWKQAQYLQTTVIPAKPPGSGKFANDHRDMLIVRQIEQLQLVGFHPTRSAESRSAHRDSGCDIVREALEKAGRSLSYSAIETVWKNRDKLTTGNPTGDLIQDVLRDYIAHREH